MQHTWVSPNTLGEESTVTLTFQKQGEETLMTLVHSGLPIRKPEEGMREVGSTFWTSSLSSSEMAHARKRSSGQYPET